MLDLLKKESRLQRLAPSNLKFQGGKNGAEEDLNREAGFAQA
jgi:hypothetical protein